MSVDASWSWTTGPPPVQAQRAGISVPLRLVLAVASLVALGVCCLLSLKIGVRPVSVSQVWHAFTDYHPTVRHPMVAEVVVRELRLPRTLVAVGAGASLAVAGALMQALTRNPLADPGILGVNTGASLGVLLMLSVGGITDPNKWVWGAFPGALAAALLVYGMASVGGGGASPIKLVLAGTVVGLFMSSVISLVLFWHPMNKANQQDILSWTVGDVDGHGIGQVVAVLPMMLAGLVTALTLARSLNVISLGEDTAVALGLRIGLVRTATVLAIVLLAGAATAEAGPIAFVGLVVPNGVRALVGSDYRWILPLSASLGSVLLLASDIVGRVVIAPSEIPTGIMVALVGAPVFLLLARRKRLVGL